MTLQQLIRIIRARHRVILATMLLFLLAAIAAILILPPRYSASTSLVINIKGIDPITGTALPADLLPSYMTTQVDIVQSYAVAKKVAATLKLADNAELKNRFIEKTGGKGSMEDWIIGQLLDKLDVKPSRESRILAVNFTDADPEFAARVANGFARAFIQTDLDMKVTPAKDSTVWFDEQVTQLKRQFEDAQNRLSKYQKDKGFTSTDQRTDIDAAKLAEISTQLVQVEAQVYENASRQKQLEDFRSKKRSVDSLPEILASPVIQELKSRLSIAEGKLSQAPSSIGTSHPDYQRLQSEVTTLRKRLNEEIDTTAAVIGNNLRVAQSRERELRDSVAAQKSRLLDSNRHRDELEVMMKEVDNAQRAYQAASQRRAETSLGSQADQGNVVVLNPALVPVKPSFPRPLLMLAAAFVVGGMFGVALALTREILDRRVRGAADLAQVLGIPVWGVIEDTTALSRPVDRKNKRALKRNRLFKSIREPALGLKN